MSGAPKGFWRRNRFEIAELWTSRRCYELEKDQFFRETLKAFEIWSHNPSCLLARIPKQRARLLVDRNGETLELKAPQT